MSSSGEWPNIEGSLRYGPLEQNENTEEALTVPTFSDDEPTREQLIATGEIEDGGGEQQQEESEQEGEEGEEEDEGGEEGKEEEASPTTAPGTGEAASTSVRKQIEERLMAGATREELLTDGYNKSSISTVASEVKKKLGTRMPVGRKTSIQTSKTQIFAKGSPPEAIIESIEVPNVSDGQSVPFEQGIKFGMSLLVLATRMMQELSAIGITQTKPLIDMAKSMREGEAVAAKNAAGEAAMEAAGMVQQSLMPMLANLQRPGGGDADPVKAMMTRTMEPIISRLMGGLVGGLASRGQTPPVSPQPAQLTAGVDGQPGVEGWSRKSE